MSKIRLLQYRGKSALSTAIIWQTRSLKGHSHSALLTPENSVIESWARHGVGENDHIGSVHTPGTLVDVYQLNFDFDEAELLRHLRDHIGAGYDWRSVIRFVSRLPAHMNGRWFCSELILDGFHHVGSPLLSIEPHHGSPRDIGILPPSVLKYETTLSTTS